MSSSQAPSPRLADKIWQDFDDKAVFEDVSDNAAAAACQNFVLEFGPTRARIARDVSQDDFQDLLGQEKRDTEYPIRWINIWDTGSSADIVKVIGTKYAFSQRLISLMINATLMKQRGDQFGKKRNLASRSRNRPQLSMETGDPEMGLSNDPSRTSTSNQAKGSLPLLEGEEIQLYLLLKETVNYSSIDHTEKALCIGAHWLHKKPEKPGQQAEVDEHNLMPPKHWLWLVLCDDHTVITFHEGHKPGPNPKGWTKEEWHAAQYRNIRANSLDVLLQQSEHGMAKYEQRPLSQNSIRQALKKAQDRSRSSKPELSRVHSDMAPIGVSPGTTLDDEGTSSLFYYLFEDYTAAGPLKAAGQILEDLAPQVLHSAERKSRVKSRDIIQPLHFLSRDLRKLRHLFENYMTMIGKILVATKRPGPPQPDPHFSLPLRSDTNLSESLIMSSDPGRKVFLAASALQRFDRLQDRLRSVMLNTIDGHFEEITALQDTYFNLTQQKDSAATARLTRSATLLAKLSVFFLPISFITSYFSVQIEDLYIYWDKETYWYTFAVTAAVSFFALFFFGKLLMFFSDIMDGWAEKITEWFAIAVRRVGFKIQKGEEDED